MKLASTSCRFFVELINPTETKKSFSISRNTTKAQAKLAPGLSPVRQANSAKEMAILLSPHISERFTLDKLATKKMRSQLVLYFKSTRITDKSYLGMMTDHASWAVPDSFATDTEALEQLTVPVLLLLTKLSTYSIQLRNEPLYLCTGVIFANLSKWYDRYDKKEANKRPKAIINPVSIPKLHSTQDHKIPIFKVPNFHGNTFKGDEFINKVDRSFRSAAMARYLESTSYCDNNPCWSGALHPELGRASQETTF